MADDERILALKKAYADMITNTEREASARVWAAERKTLRFQHELAVAKEEGLQLMLRLKSMMDSKDGETEMSSRNQQKKIEELEAQLQSCQAEMTLVISRSQKKIEELEAQLQEGEDIVAELREELRYEQGKLAREIAISEEASKGNRLYTSQSVVYPAPSESQYDSLAATEMKTLYLNHIRSSYGSNTKLPSIISRSKENEFYRNGCTQRIRACERNALDGELSLSKESNDKNGERKVKSFEEGKGILPARTDDNCEKKVNGDEEDKGILSACTDENSEKKVKGDEQDKSILPACTDENREKKVKDDEEDESILPARMDEAGNMSNVDQNEAALEDGPLSSWLKVRRKKSFRGKKDRVDRFMENRSPSSVKNSAQSEGNHINIAPSKCVKKSVALFDMLVALEKEGGPTERSVVQISNSGIEKVEIPPPVDPRPIKYTFQRKRKRGEPSGSSDGNASFENSPAKRNTEGQ